MATCNDVVIVDAYRTPVGKFNGCFAPLKAHDLGAEVIRKLLDSCAVKADDVSEVILGQALTAGQGQNPARQASVKAGLPYSVPAYSVGFLCGSGLKAVVNGYQTLKCGDARVVIAGGQESMSNAPHCVHMRDGMRFGNVNLVDSMLTDGLVDVFYNYHMGITAENVAKQWNISREEQDTFSADSQRKIAEAQKNGFYTNEIAAVTVTKRKETTTFSTDEFPTPNTSTQVLSKLRPAFVKDGRGSVTAGNASGVNDGAAACLLTTVEEARRLSLKKPLARIVSWAQVGIDPSIMGTAPIEAVRKAIAKAGWQLENVDLFELNEAFAAQSIAVIKELKIPIEKVNVNGGSIGIGHPIGASGCRILVTLLHAMKRLSKRKGVAALCIGGGMGIAICVEQCD